MPTHYVIHFRPEFGYARAMAVKANKAVERGSSTVFLRGSRTVYQAPTRYIFELHEHPNQISAEEQVKELLRARSDGPNFKVREYGVARRSAPKEQPQGGFLAEGINARIVEL